MTEIKDTRTIEAKAVLAGESEYRQTSIRKFFNGDVIFKGMTALFAASIFITLLLTIYEMSSESIPAAPREIIYRSGITRL